VRYRQLGSSGLRCSVVGLGANNFGGRLDQRQTDAVVHAALDAGVNLIDTADSYGNVGGSEEAVGSAVAKRRDEVVLATKFGSDLHGALGPDLGARASRRYIRQAVEASLRRLRTDRIDLYQLHRPDRLTPFEETLSTLDDLVREGKVLYVGSSNLSAWEVVEADWLARERGTVRFVSAQNHLSLLHRQAESELLPACRAHGVGVLPFFPLANGLLTGKWRKGMPPPAGSRLAEAWAQRLATEAAFDAVEALGRFASARGLPMVTVAIGALLAKPAVTSVIAGATSPEQVLANVAAADWEPSPEDLAEVDRLTPAPAEV
jgi:aryl-alcohol dehydrogenase-like predicted oxidoreductase